MKSSLPNLFLPLVALLVMSLVLTGCASVPRGEPGEVDYSPLERALNEQDCEAANQALEGLADHQAARAAVMADARLEVAYLCLSDGAFDAAWEQSMAFLRAFGDHPHADYGYYLAGLSRFAAWQALHEGGQVPDPDQDSAAAREAFALFRDLVRQFPESGYRDEVAPHLMELREGLAQAELRIARARFEQGDHQQAMARAEYVNEHFRATRAQGQALLLMADVLEARGDEAGADRLRRRAPDIPQGD
ncbi:outer membrane protein assembly factor BamD [Ectothiorhodospira variabilis]|uniref:outer membrane protein assembly factor BamD n=1 Tax=Ectothiorhodospira variabilis TaxID=505694 RepID=UPI001EFACBFD|nr:outer membrane protein assembly factor BamD [Ectothiorhodospira variabilis]MCG5494351.1 outer membrane protein assembly factor BamD [Ectothiorhodospira variabilis]MCG5504118.1 outer membrane protein assembly factor BamD [Ectothiorhodospira variabilis]MCG5507273.1 outer membrane protein assembly factor BamD [Ectothiorhodospira variabilis]